MPNSNSDSAVQQARRQIEVALNDSALRPKVISFFDEATHTVSYLVCDPRSRNCAIIDSVLDFDAASGHTSTDSAQAIVDEVRSRELTVQWLLETHVHADHLSAAPWLQSQVGGSIAIGQDIRQVQDSFAGVFNVEETFARDGSQFDRLFADGDSFKIGELSAAVLAAPGHTPACLAYVIGDAVFVGDTLFMPDYGTARCDFPGGDARTLYRSIRRLLSLPDATRVFVCHDYKAPGREQFAWETSIGEQRQNNVHIHDGVDEDAFVKLRESRDAGLGMPRLLLPSIQINMRAGRMPPAESNGVTYLKLPLNLV